MRNPLSVWARLTLVGALTMTACGQTPSGQPDAELKPEIAQGLTADSKSSSPNRQNNRTINSYTEYCFQRVGQIQGEPRRGEVCRVNAGGSGGRMEELARPERNSASVHISAPSLEAIGVDSVSFNLNRGGATPKFPAGAHTMDQVRIWDIEMDPVDLPDRIVYVSDATGKENLFSWTMPDAQFLRSADPDFDLPGYEIASAVLTIDRAIDLPVDPDAAEMAATFGLTTGEQYIEGTLNISLIPMGSKGEQFGPNIFEFATTLGWGYAK
jgi:hypothetical protein